MRKQILYWIILIAACIELWCATGAANAQSISDREVAAISSACRPREMADPRVGGLFDVTMQKLRVAPTPVRGLVFSKLTHEGAQNGREWSGKASEREAFSEIERFSECIDRYFHGSAFVFTCQSNSPTNFTKFGLVFAWVGPETDSGMIVYGNHSGNGIAFTGRWTATPRQSPTEIDGGQVVLRKYGSALAAWTGTLYITQGQFPVNCTLR